MFLAARARTGFQPHSVPVLRAAAASYTSSSPAAAAAAAAHPRAQSGSCSGAAAEEEGKDFEDEQGEEEEEYETLGGGGRGGGEDDSDECGEDGLGRAERQGGEEGDGATVLYMWRLHCMLQPPSTPTAAAVAGPAWVNLSSLDAEVTLLVLAFWAFCAGPYVEYVSLLVCLLA